MVSASLKLDDLDDLLDVDLDSEDYDSLGGYIIELLDHLPSEGETAEDEHFLLKLFLLIRTVWKQFISFQRAVKKNLAFSCKVLFVLLFKIFYSGFEDLLIFLSVNIDSYIAVTTF